MSNIVEFPQSDVERYRNLKNKILASQFEPVAFSPKRKKQVPMLIGESGYLHEHANEFLLTRFHHPEVFSPIAIKTGRKKGFSPVTLTTIKNYAEHIRNWLNICASQGRSYLNVDEAFLDSVLDVMRDDDCEDDEEPVKESSIQVYLNTWRLFYDYLDVINVSHTFKIPSKVRQERQKSRLEDEARPFNYAISKKTNSILVDPKVKAKRMVKTKDYTSQVLTKEQMKCLITELSQIDIVYAVMAHVQLDTLLRINELVHHFPYEADKANKNWKSWGQLKLEEQECQKLKFIGKGQIEREIDVSIKTMKLLSDKYITAKEENSDITIYDERKQLYLTKYLQSKLGKESEFDINSNVLWLSKNGTPVSKTMYRKAFAKAAKILRDKKIIDNRIYLRPHGIRHTGATLRLLKYQEEQGVEIHMANLDDIHAFIQELLGHVQPETTARYIETVGKLKIGDLALKTILRQEDFWEEELIKNSPLAKGVSAIKS